MNSSLNNGSGLIFMKVGIHANESIEDIIKRKQDEFAAAGKIFWGYGGNTCHPTKHVQPFAREYAESGNNVQLVMHKMVSKHFTETLAKEYSDDGLEWQPIPKGINVKGSRYGMVIGGINEEEFDLNLRSLIVGVGPSRGKIGADYIKGQNDKGVFVYQDSENEPEEKEVKHIDLVAPLLPPYAVFLR